MVDIFAQENIEPHKDIFALEGIELPKDIFAIEGIAPPTIQEKNMEALSPIPVNKASDVAQQQFAEDTDQYELLARARFSESQIQAMKNKGPIGFFEAKDFLSYNEVLPAGGLYQAMDTITILKAAKKIEAGEELSVTEETTLNAFIDKQVEMNIRGLKVGGGIAYYGAQMPAFMVEFAATGGIGKSAQQAAQKSAQELVEKVVKKKIKSQMVSKTAGVAANVVARTAALPTMYAPKYGELRVNDYMAVTDKGAVLFKESSESPAVSALKAFGYTSTEVASELSGAAIGKYVIKPIGRAAGTVLKTPMAAAANKLPMNVKQGLYQAYKSINPNARVSNVFSAAGWNGMLEELGEERVADILRGSLNLATDRDYTFEDFLDEITPDKDQLLIEAGVIAIAGGVKSSADIAFNLIVDKIGDVNVARETVDNMTATELDSYVNKELKPQAQETQPSVLTQDVVSAAQSEAAKQQDPPDIINEESNFERIRRDWDDDLRPIQKLVEDAEKVGAKVKSGTDPYKMARQFRKIGGMTDMVLQHNTYFINDEGNAEVTGKSYKAILDDFDSAVAHKEADRDQRRQDFDDYLIARRINEDLIPNENMNVSASDVKFAEEAMVRLTEKYGEDLGWFAEFSNELYDFKGRVMNDWLVREGVISKEFADELQATHARHVPFERVFEENKELNDFLGKQFTGASSKSIIKKMFGSDRDIKSPTVSIMKQTMKIIATAQRNRVAREVAGLSEFMPEYVQKVKTPMKKVTVEDPETGKKIETYRPTGIAPKGTITVYEDGKPKYYKLSKPLLEAMEGLPQNDLAGVWKAMQILSGAPILTRGATRYNPDFVFKNIVRDQLQAVIMSEARPIPFVDLAKGISANIGKNEYYQQWLASGGKMSSFMDLSDNTMEKALKELTNEKSSKLRYLNPLNIIGDAVDFSEKATRVGVFQKAKEKGMTDVDAAIESLEASVDFTRGGRVSKIVNKFVPFFNAGVQGTTKFVRAFKKNPKAVAMWGTATITIPNLMVTAYYLYGAPEDEREEYLNFPEYVHALSTPVKLGDTWYYVPKPFAPGYIFGSMPQMFLMWMHKENKPEAKEFAAQMANGLYGAVTPWYDSSSLIPTTVRVLIENQTNYNFFLGRNIYPSWMEDMLPEDQINKNTTETAKLLGSGLDKSPAIVDNTIRGFLGGSGRYITDISDWIINDIKKARGEVIPEKPRTLNDVPVIRSFVQSTPTGFRAETTQMFFDKWEEVSAIHKSFGKKDGENKIEFMEKYEKELQMYKPLKSYYDRIREIGKMSDMIYNDLNMTAEEKAEQLSENDRMILDIAKEANEWYREQSK